MATNKPQPDDAVDPTEEEETDEDTPVNKEEKEAKKDEPYHRPLSKILDLAQYMRQDNEADVELIEKLDGRIDLPDGWEKEDHLDDFRPGYWYRKDNYVVQFYAVMGALAVVLCRAPKKGEQDDKKQDATMIVPLIPFMEVPYEDEDGEEDWDNATEKANSFFKQIIEYIDEKDDRRKEDEKLKGGVGDGRPDLDFDAKALAAGTEVEKEHTDDPEKAKEIAKDHLTEDPRYYDKLKKVEGEEKKPRKKSKFRKAE